PLFTPFHFSRDKLRHDLRASLPDYVFLECVIPLMRQSSLANQGEFRLDPLHIFHQDCKHFLSPLIEKLLLHLVENNSWIGRWILYRFIPPCEPIITPALFRIADDLIGLIDLTNLSFGLCTVRVAIWMMLKDQLPVGLLDHVVRRIARDPQHSVEIDSSHGEKL